MTTRRMPPDDELNTGTGCAALLEIYGLSLLAISSSRIVTP